MALGLMSAPDPGSNDSDPVQHEEDELVDLLPPGKIPKLRFDPGQYVKIGDTLYEIAYCFRVASNPHEWMWCLEERASLPEATDVVEDNEAEEPVRMIDEIFMNDADAHRFFRRLPHRGHSRTLANREMVRTAEVVEFSKES